MKLKAESQLMDWIWVDTYLSSNKYEVRTHVQCVSSYTDIGLQVPN